MARVITLEQLAKKNPKRHEQYLKRRNRRTVSLFGVDVKITPDGKIRIIEVNGQDASWRSSKVYNSDHMVEQNIIDALGSTGLPVSIVSSGYYPTPYGITRVSGGTDTEIDYVKIGSKDNLSRELKSKGFQRKGKTTDRGISRRNRYSLFASPSEPEAVLWDMSYGDLHIDESRYLALNPRSFRDAIENKWATRELLSGIEEAVSRGVLLNRRKKDKKARAELEDIAKSSEYLVIKPLGGTHGKGIRIVPSAYFLEGDKLKEDIYSVRDEVGDLVIPRGRKVTLVEEFVEGRPIKSKYTLQEHDGCMRYFMAVESFEDGSTKMHHLGGYWRYSANPINSNSTLEDRFKANASSGAITQSANRSELKIVRKELDRIFPQFYRRALGCYPDLDLVVDDDAKVESTAHFIRRRERNKRVRRAAQSTNQLIEFSYFDLRRADRNTLEAIALKKKAVRLIAEDIPGINKSQLKQYSAPELRRAVMDARTRMILGENVERLNESPIRSSDTSGLLYKAAYAWAMSLGIEERAELSPQKLRLRLNEYLLENEDKPRIVILSRTPSKDGEIICDIHTKRTIEGLSRFGSVDVVVTDSRYIHELETGKMGVSVGMEYRNGELRKKTYTKPGTIDFLYKIAGSSRKHHVDIGEYELRLPNIMKRLKRKYGKNISLSSVSRAIRTEAEDAAGTPVNITSNTAARCFSKKRTESIIRKYEARTGETVPRPKTYFPNELKDPKIRSQLRFPLIVKPTTGTHGNGISVVRGLDELDELKLERMIVQECKTDTVLVDGHKVDIRLCIVPTVTEDGFTNVTYGCGVVRVAGAKYDPQKVNDLSVMLTNDTYRHNIVGVGNAVNIPLEQADELNYQELIPRLLDVSRQVVRAMMSHKKGCPVQEMGLPLGLDFLVDSYGNPLLIEANGRPNMFEWGDSVDTYVADRFSQTLYPTIVAHAEKHYEQRKGK